jgi:hypothetical protein
MRRVLLARPMLAPIIFGAAQSLLLYQANSFVFLVRRNEKHMDRAHWRISIEYKQGGFLKLYVFTGTLNRRTLNPPANPITKIVKQLRRTQTATL